MCPVLPHPGYLGAYANPGSDPVILGGTGPADIHFDYVAADFSIPYAVVARITIEAAPMGGEIGAVEFHRAFFPENRVGHGSPCSLFFASQKSYSLWAPNIHRFHRVFI